MSTKPCWRCNYIHSGMCCDWDWFVPIQLAGVCKCCDLCSGITYESVNGDPESCGNCGRWHSSKAEWSEQTDWRLSLNPELDKFARMLLEKDSNMARRVIRSALGYYRKLLTDRSQREFPANPYTTDLIERSNVASLLIELWDEADN